MRRFIPCLAFVGFAALTGCQGAMPKSAQRQAPVTAVAAPETPKKPSVKASELVAFDAASANKFVRAGEASEITVRVRVGALTMKDAPRPKINVGLVVDTSGSMEGKAIEDAKAASQALLDALSPGDTLAVVAFHSTTDVLVPSTRLDAKSIAFIKEQIGSMRARGTTDMAGGLRAGLDEVIKGFQASGVNRVVLLGDGVPNSDAEIRPMAESAAGRAVSITMLGLGLDYNETLMSDVASRSGGTYHFIKESSSVASVFKEEVLRLKQMIGRGAALRLSPGPGVSIKSVVGLPSQTAGASTLVTLGDLSEGDQRDVIVRLSVSGRKAGSVVELLDAVLSFDGPAIAAGGTLAASGRLEERGFIAVKATDDKAEIAAGHDIDVERSAARVGVADMVLRAIAMARAGNLQAAQALVDGAEKEAQRAAKALDDPELQEKAKSMGPLRESLPSLVRQQQAAVGFSQAPIGPQAMAEAMAAPAAVVMDSHKDAVRTIQGL